MLEWVLVFTLGTLPGTLGPMIAEACVLHLLQADDPAAYCLNIRDGRSIRKPSP